MFTSPTQAQTHTRIWTSQRGERSENAGGILRPDSFFLFLFIFLFRPDSWSLADKTKAPNSIAKSKKTKT